MSASNYTLKSNYALKSNYTLKSNYALENNSGLKSNCLAISVSYKGLSGGNWFLKRKRR